MNSNLKMFASRAILVLASCHLALLPTAAQANMGNAQGMEGSWTVLVTIRDCASGAPLFTFPAMQTYAQGGTMQDSSADSRRTSGHGVWRHAIGSTYRASFQFFNFDANGAPQGTTRVSMTNTVDRRGESFTTDAAVKVYDLMGNLVGQACATSIASRFSTDIN